MLDPETVARMKEILGGHRCRCGKPADRFRGHGKTRLEYFCHACYTEEMERLHPEEEPPIVHKVYRKVCLEYDDPENVMNLCWAPPLRPRSCRFRKLSKSR